MQRIERIATQWTFNCWSVRFHSSHQELSIFIPFHLHRRQSCNYYGKRLFLSTHPYYLHRVDHICTGSIDRLSTEPADYTPENIVHWTLANVYFCLIRYKRDLRTTHHREPSVCMCATFFCMIILVCACLFAVRLTIQTASEWARQCDKLRKRRGVLNTHTKNDWRVMKQEDLFHCEFSITSTDIGHFVSLTSAAILILDEIYFDRLDVFVDQKINKNEEWSNSEKTINSTIPFGKWALNYRSLSCCWANVQQQKKFSVLCSFFFCSSCVMVWVNSYSETSEWISQYTKCYGVGLIKSDHIRVYV